MRITFANQAEFSAFKDGELNNFCNDNETDWAQSRRRTHHMDEIGNDLSLDSEELNVDDLSHLSVFVLN